ncbi:adhesion G-protein coupled receptor D1-like isoform X3 [Nematostella vectensis]|uniref:adhesion G-protein coupled receptor D1-like isoform X3 n=1 Tax=Nematostella vectensis TaxID=45351 RepID=UPI0020772F92|nr:adhesion G-protein coupled receptor D1-like isoform X3 [Nematostella vectensis]
MAFTEGPQRSYNMLSFIVVIIIACLPAKSDRTQAVNQACTTLDGTYSYENSRGPNQKNWDNSVSACATKPGCLARPFDAASLSAIKNAIKGNPHDNYWSGIKFDHQSGKFKFGDGTMVVETGAFLAIVNKNEQLINGYSKRCLAINPRSDTLIAETCTNKLKFVCQLASSDGSTTAPPFTASSPTPTDGSTTAPPLTASSPTPTENPNKPNGRPTPKPPNSNRPSDHRPTDRGKPTDTPGNSARVQSYNDKIKSQNPVDPKSLDDVVQMTIALQTSIKNNNEYNNGDKGKNTVMQAEKELEKFLLEYAKVHLTANKSKITKNSEGIALSIELVPANSTRDLEFPSVTSPSNSTVSTPRSSYVALPPNIFSKKDVYVVTMVMSDVRKMLPSDAQVIADSNENKRTELNSAVVSCTLDPHPQGTLEENISIVLHHDQATKDGMPDCVFWDVHAKTEYNGTWSTYGCSVAQSNASTTTCTCNHMTSFALLMQVSDTKVHQKHRRALAYITYIGCSFSLAGEILTVAAYIAFMNIKQEQCQIRVNLMFALAIAQIFFLSGITATDVKGVCIFVAIVIHYMYLVAFGWMMLEGVYLYLMVVKVFNTDVKMKLYYAFSYGFPLLMVLLSVVIASTMEGGIDNYTNNEFCWVSFSNGLVWTFVSPVLLISLVNFIILIRVVREMTRLQNSKSSDTSNTRQSVKACVVLFPLLGLTWVFGVLAVTDAGLVFQYLFTILNSLQGLLIFVLHVLRSSEIRHAFERRRRQWQTTRATDLSSSRSHSDNSASYATPYKPRPLKDHDSDSLQGKRNQVAPSPTPIRADSARTIMTPIECARDNFATDAL